jgi:hypothetical protein
MYWTGQRLKAYYCAGGVLWVFCGASILFLPRSLSAFMYVISVFIGVANTLMTVWHSILYFRLYFMWWNCVVKSPLLVILWFHSPISLSPDSP